MFQRGIQAYLEGALAKILEDADFKKVDLTVEDGAHGFLGCVEVSAKFFSIGAGACIACDPDANAAVMDENPFPVVLVLYLKRLRAE